MFRLQKDEKVKIYWVIYTLSITILWQKSESSTTNELPVVCTNTNYILLVFVHTTGNSFVVE